MSAYRLEDERAIRTGRLVDDWTKSGLLIRAQRDIVMPQLAVDLRRTNKFLRTTLFIFGAIILQSTVGLLVVTIGAAADSVVASMLCVLLGGACFWLAAQLVRRYRWYRFGVEEAAALSAAGLIAAGAAVLFGGDSEWSVTRGLGSWMFVVALAVGAAALTVLYLYFGYVYAAVMAMAAAAAVPFQFGDTEMVQRTIAVIILVAIASASRVARVDQGDEHPDDALAVIEAAAWLGIYVLVNLVLSSGITPLDRAASAFWITYAGIWLLPVAGLWRALRGRERPLLLVSIVMALGTLLSNKEYWGSPRFEWDPIVFGVLLMVMAVGLRRWLASGDGGMRHGYTAARFLVSDKSALGGLAMVSAVHTEVPVAQSAPPVDPSIGGGGRSGGAGGGGSF